MQLIQEDKKQIDWTIGKRKNLSIVCMKSSIWTGRMYIPYVHQWQRLRRVHLTAFELFVAMAGTKFKQRLTFIYFFHVHLQGIHFDTFWPTLRQNMSAVKRKLQWIYEWMAHIMINEKPKNVTCSIFDEKFLDRSFY